MNTKYPDLENSIDTIKSIIKGKINVGIIHLTKRLAVKFKLEKYHFHYIPLSMTSRDTMVTIIYNDEPEAKIKAHKLYDDITQKSKNKPITEEAIRKYIIEATFDLDKKVVEVVKDEENNDVKICTVNGEFVKGTNPGLGFIEFVEGGHHYVDSYPGYKKHIPEDEIWVDEVFYKTPENFKGIVGHEFQERNKMKYHKMSYDSAHDLSNKSEKRFRSRKEKLNESFQFNKTKDLMKKIA